MLTLFLARQDMRSLLPTASVRGQEEVIFSLLHPGEARLLGTVLICFPFRGNTQIKFFCLFSEQQTCLMFPSAFDLTRGFFFPHCSEKRSSIAGTIITISNASLLLFEISVITLIEPIQEKSLA